MLLPALPDQSQGIDYLSMMHKHEMEMGPRAAACAAYCADGFSLGYPVAFFGDYS